MVCINNYSFLLLNTFINGYIKTPRPSYISSGYICSILFFIFPGKKFFFFAKYVILHGFMWENVKYLKKTCYKSPNVKRQLRHVV